MQRSAQRRSPTTARNRRVIAIAAAVVVFGGMFAVSQVSDAATRRLGFGNQRQKAAPCASASAASTKKYNTKSDLKTSTNGQVENHEGDGQAANADTLARQSRQRGRQNNQNCTPSASASSSGGTEAGGGNNGGGDNSGGSNGGAPNDAGGADGNNNGLQVLGRQCEGRSQLQLHDGFQSGNKCVNTEFGEVASAANDPSLLITQAPRQVRVNEAFTLTISTRNLVRDRFLGAAAGGYYLESSFLNADGLTRGHFHTSCRMLENTTEAPNPEPVPAFFVATEDGKGGRTPDTVQINVPGLPSRGTAQCASWAGEGSHRIPMMERANQNPAFDTVRINVR